MGIRRVLYVLVAVVLSMAPLAAHAAKPPAPPPANPVVTSISSYGQQPGTALTINGSGFGPKKESNYPMFAGARAVVITWTDTQIVARVPNNAGPGYVGVQVDGVISNGKYFVPGTPPQVTSISAAGAEAGQQVTITGIDFGTTQGIGWATVAGVSANVVSWSDTQVVIETPATAAPGWIGVWQNGICSNGSWFVAGGLPEITSVSKTVARPGDSITITGKHFGVAPESSQALRWGSDTIQPDVWSDTQITFTAPAESDGGYLGIVRDGVVSNGVQLAFGAHIESLSSWWGEPGTAVTITGDGFGDAPERVTFGGVDAEVLSWSRTRVVARVPAQAPEGNVGVWRGSIASNGKWFLPAFKPTISAISPVAASPGETVTVKGSHFGTDTADARLTLSGQRVEPITWTDTEITFSMPETLAAGYVGVTRSGLTSNGRMLYPRARIASLSSGYGLPGTEVTINGVGFGDTPDRVTFAGIDAPIVSWTPTAIRVRVPDGAIEGQVGVWRGSFASNGMLFVPIAKPQITSVSTARVSAGDVVTITGSGFGPAPDGSGALTLGGTPITASSWSDAQIVFTVPEGSASGYLGVHRRGLTSNGMMLYVGPRVTSLSAWWGEPGKTLTITGAGFGDTPGAVQFASTPATITSWTKTQIVVTIPAAAEGNVVVTAGGAASNGSWFLPMYAPKITGTSVSSASVGTTVTINGQYFGDTQGASTVKLAGVAMPVISWSDTSIVVTVPSGATSGYIGVTKRGVSSNGRWFGIKP